MGYRIHRGAEVVVMPKSGLVAALYQRDIDEAVRRGEGNKSLAHGFTKTLQEDVFFEDDKFLQFDTTGNLGSHGGYHFQFVCRGRWDELWDSIFVKQHDVSKV